MRLEGHVQGRFRFAGKLRVPGEIISADDLDTATPQARDALVSQKLMILSAEGAPVEGGDNGYLLAKIEVMQGEIAALKAALNQPSDALVAAIKDVALQAVRAAQAAPEEAIEGAPRRRRARV